VCLPCNSISGETGYSPSKVFGIGALRIPCHAIWFERFNTRI
jgi:hypothetical protein